MTPVMTGYWRQGQIKGQMAEQWASFRSSAASENSVEYIYILKTWLWVNMTSGKPETTVEKHTRGVLMFYWLNFDFTKFIMCFMMSYQAILTCKKEKLKFRICTFVFSVSK